MREKIKIVGIDCPTCVYSIQRNLGRLRGFRRIDIDPASGEAVVEYDDEECLLKDIYEAVRDAGYDILKERIILSLHELSENEASSLESRISRIPGVLENHTSLVTKLVSITYNPLTTTTEELITKIKNLGVSVAGLTEEITSKKPREKLTTHRRLTTFAIGLFAVTQAMLNMHQESPTNHLNETLLATLTIVAVSLGYDIIVRGVKTLMRLSPTMDSLIALSTLTTLTAGVTGTLGFIEWSSGLNNTSFFEASAGVIGFVSLGKYLEERLRKRSFKSLEDLAKTLYGKARIIENGTTKEKNITNITPGEVVEVRAGEIVPVDGVVVDGWGYVDESSFTGEPIPKLKKAETRDPVLAGSILTSGYLRIRVTRVSKDTALYHIIETVREAQFYKPEIMRIADKIVGLLTWSVIAVATSTLIYWWFLAGEPALALTFTAAVLAIACPCGLGIAVPMVVSIAVLRATRNGILVRRGDAFERASEVRVVLF
ncbi:MAG: heavy metal translocating P-type ATPase, partial [Zestosphaera sp.]